MPYNIFLSLCYHFIDKWKFDSDSDIISNASILFLITLVGRPQPMRYFYEKVDPYIHSVHLCKINRD